MGQQAAPYSSRLCFQNQDTHTDIHTERQARIEYRYQKLNLDFQNHHIILKASKKWCKGCTPVLASVPENFEIQAYRKLLKQIDFT